MLNFIKHIYEPFFNISYWENALFNPESWVIIISLIIMECLLSVDNAIVLAAQTNSLPTKKLQKKSLIYGLGFAYIFRFVVIGICNYLINMWIIKLIGALYLMVLGIFHIYKIHINKKDVSSNKVGKHKKVNKSFWSTILSIELMDVVFSIDSVLASLAMSNNPVIILIGGMIGILSMRGVAQLIISLMKNIPELELMAYYIVLVISIKLLISIPLINIEIPDSYFTIFIVFIILGTILIHYYKSKH